MPKLVGATAPAPLAPPLVFAVAAALGALSLLVQLTIFDRNFVSMDEGHLALTASRLRDGDLLYRDIHTGIFPGIYALTAGLFAIFGEDLFATRVAQVAVNVGTVVLLWLIGLRIVAARWALLPPLVFVGLVLVAFPVLSMFNYSSLAGLLALAALASTLRYLEGGTTADGVAIGLLVGLCLFTKQNYGGLAALAIAGGILIARQGSALRGRGLVAAFLPIVAAGTLFLALAIGALAATGTLGPWVDSTLLSLVGSQLEDFDNPIPPILGAHPPGDIRFTYLYIPSALFDYLVRGDSFLGMPVSSSLVSWAIRLSYGLPLAALMTAPVLLAFGRPGASGGRDPAAETEQERGPGRPDVTVVVFAIVFFFGIFPSAVFSHLVYVMAPVLLVFAWIGARLEEIVPRKAAGAVFGAAALGAAASLAASATIPAHIRGTYSEPSRLPGVSLRVAADQAALHGLAMRFIEDCARPEEPIFTLPILPVLYLSSGRPNPVKWDLLIPGAIDEQAIVETLERERVRCIVRQRDMNPEFRPLEQLYPTLDQYVKRNYRKGRELRGGQQVWYGLGRSTPFDARESAKGR